MFHVKHGAGQPLPTTFAPGRAGHGHRTMGRGGQPGHSLFRGRFRAYCRVGSQSGSAGGGQRIVATLLESRRPMG